MVLMGASTVDMLVYRQSGRESHLAVHGQSILSSELSWSVY